MAKFGLEHNILRVAAAFRGVPKKMNTALHREMEMEALRTKANLAAKTPKKWSGKPEKLGGL